METVYIVLGILAVFVGGVFVGYKVLPVFWAHNPTLTPKAIEAHVLADAMALGGDVKKAVDNAVAKLKLDVTDAANKIKAKL